MKIFLRPTIAKLSLMILFLFATLFFPKTAEICSLEVTTPSGCERISVQGIGLPIFYGDKFMGDVVYQGFYPLNFVANIVLYYLIASMVIFFYNYYRGLNKKY
ncbi:MAG: hypothetical protein Q8R40_03270 [bacterium]|nr:hypothetical protein [bacterium]